MPNCFISREKNQFAVGVIGGPTVVIDYGGVRFLADPCFDPPGQAGPYAKLEGPAIDPDELGTADVVLLSHDEHGDNLDRRGREYAMSTGCVVTTPGGAARLGAPAIGLATWETTRLTRTALRSRSRRSRPSTARSTERAITAGTSTARSPASC